MMVSMETVMLRMKRRMEKLLDVPGVRAAGIGAAYFGGGALLSAAPVWSRMQPGAIALTFCSTGWRRGCAALGSILGYRLFWGEEGMQGMLWSAGALILAWVLPMLEQGNRLRWRLAASAACLTAGIGAAVQLRFGGEPALLVMRAAIAGACGLLIGAPARLLRWLFLSCAVLALTGLRGWLGAAAVGLLSSAAPLPAAMLAAAGAEVGMEGAVSLPGIVCLSRFLQRVPLEKEWARALAPGAACAVLMAAKRVWMPELLAAVSLGGAAGALFRQRNAVRRGQLGIVQVRLEQTAWVLARFQRQLLEYSPPEPDAQALAEQMQQTACGSCAMQEICPERRRMNAALLEDGAPFLCKQPERASPAVRRGRDTLRRIRAARAVQEGYRMALVQQYGFLSEALHRLSDGLAEPRQYVPRFRVVVSARSRGRALADGDRVTAFPGTACRYYVLLCDGMGTGLGAAEESRTASGLIRQMLAAGMPPESVLGSVNSQLTLTDRGGAVTVDLAELRLDSGRVWLYKWGAGQSWLLKRRKAAPLGCSGPPPGLDIRRGRENISHAFLDRGETMVMLSDGVSPARASAWAARAGDMQPSELARYILDDSGSPGDDATVVTVRLIRK